jgi:hypothetical protein
MAFDAGVAELADASDSKSLEGNLVWVRLPPPANFYCVFGTHPRPSENSLQSEFYFVFVRAEAKTNSMPAA